jgi:ABC-type nitrate/sulfonate/bicarbonate transport system substrate-binding protein
VYATTQDADDKEQAVLDAAHGAAQLCTELRDEASASASAAAGRSARAVAWAAHTNVLYANGPRGWAPIAEVLDEVDDDESNDFSDFDDKEDSSSVTEEFETASVTELVSNSWPRSGKLTAR